MLVRMAIIKKTRSNKCCRKCGEKGTFVHRWWEYKSAQPLWKTVWMWLLIVGVPGVVSLESGFL